MKKIILLLILITNISAAESMNMIGEKGKVNEVDRIIEVKMYDTFYEPSEFKIKKNEITQEEVSCINKELDYSKITFTNKKSIFAKTIIFS